MYMKRAKQVLSVLLIVSIILNLTFISSQIDLSNSKDPLGIEQTKRNIENQTKIITDEQTRSNYLNQEWTKIFEGSQFGQFLIGIDSVLQSISPIFKLLVGIEYSLSWYFFFVFGLWIGVVLIIYRGAETVFPNEKLISFFASVAIMGIAAQSHGIELFINMISPLFTNIWITIIGVVIAAFILYFFSGFTKSLGKFIREDIEKDKKKKREEKSKLLEKIEDVKLKANK